MHKLSKGAKGPIPRGTGKPLCEVLLYSSLYPVRRINDIPFFPSLKTIRLTHREIQVLSFDEVGVVMGKEWWPEKDMRGIRSSRGR